MAKKKTKKKPNQRGSGARQMMRNVRMNIVQATTGATGAVDVTISNDLVDAVLSRGGLSEDEQESLHLFNDSPRKAMTTYFQRLVSTSYSNLNWLVVPLLEALAHPENGSINTKVCAPEAGKENRSPLLTWVCQWRLLKRLGWTAQDEMVDMVLRAGANVHQVNANQTHALFLAVKYGSRKTVDMLLDAGIDPHHKDCIGRTCLYNALERPIPSIVSRLLTILPATETARIRQVDGPSIFITMADRVILPVFSMDCPVAWQNLGPPEADDLMETLLILRQQGSMFSPRGRVYLEAIGMLYRTDVQLDMGYVNAPHLYKEVAKCLVGTYLPESFQSSHISAAATMMSNITVDNGTTETVETGKKDGGKGDPVCYCPICKNACGKGIVLYCGHEFCRSCIVDHAEAMFGQILQVAIQQGGCKSVTPRCPVCDQHLCPDLLPVPVTADMNISQVMGIHEGSSNHRGPNFLTSDQVLAEATYQRLSRAQYPNVEDLRQNLQDTFRKAEKLAGTPHEGTVQFIDGQDPRSAARKLFVDVASAQPVCSDTMIQICPERGPTCIEISIRGIPLLARIANRSFYTVIAKPVVDLLGLERINKLQSREFVDVIFTKKIAKSASNCVFTCLKPFSIRVGDINVMLSNAIELSPDPTESQLYGIQLGQDFLISGRWCPMDVHIAPTLHDKTFARIDGEFSWVVGSKPGPESSKKKSSSIAKWVGGSKGSGDALHITTDDEMLRYYSHDGKVAFVPLLHFSPFDRGFFPSISLRETVEFEQCAWCCRAFPRGMVKCSACQDQNVMVSYCDEECQAAAWKIHKRRCGKPAKKYTVSL